MTHVLLPAVLHLFLGKLRASCVLIEGLGDQIPVDFPDGQVLAFDVEGAHAGTVMSQ